MRLLFGRLDEGRYETVIERRDGVCYHVKGVGHMFAIPHDLAHLAVEAALRLDRGFWGTVAEGGVFTTMTHLHGRRKPRSAERSKEILKTNEDQISEAESLVSIFNTALEAGHGPESGVLRAQLREYCWTPRGERTRTLTDLEVGAVCAAWRDMLARWQKLPIGETLEFVWSADAARRDRRSRSRHGRSAASGVRSRSRGR